ncbi:hypothetical protein P171DRAFT_426897 [Karstenula rhodostoma CBS 690.94]|uniref:Uncharacterized protein n=1 Tax=Karstenula rhodostoma CBS 690.94 TaxID=1392251 RepID=A0A9P4PWI7_9PLEO|nr:hypothetical protein P171DRAFT_426897 [Karstenula rhodostoma CBS 690.94]
MPTVATPSPPRRNHARDLHMSRGNPQKQRLAKHLPHAAIVEVLKDPRRTGYPRSP